MQAFLELANEALASIDKARQEVYGGKLPDRLAKPEQALRDAVGKVQNALEAHLAVRRPETVGSSDGGELPASRTDMKLQLAVLLKDLHRKYGRLKPSHCAYIPPLLNI
jgi:hypothetical protein